jgi:hypothetical protein
MVMNVQAYANEEGIAKFLQKEEQYAASMCQQIQQDQQWKKLLENYPALHKVYQQYPKGYNKEVGFLYAKTTAYDIARTSSSLLDKLVYQKTKAENDTDRAMMESLYRVRVMRVLNKCGILLKNQHLILLLPVFDLQRGAVDDDVKMNELMTSASCIKKYDETLISNVRVRQQPGSPDKLLFDMHGDCYKESADLYNKVVFPYHVLFEENPTEYYRQPYLVEYEKKIAGALDEVNAKFAGAMSTITTQTQNQQEKKARMVKVSSGSVSAAKSCGEVAEALITKENFVSMFAGYPISKDAQAVYDRPTQKLYSTLGRILSTKSNEIITYDKNQISGIGHAYKLKIGKKSVWFKNDVSIGKNVYFVGKYIDNDVTTVTQGQSSFDVSTRVIDVMCITSM